MILLRVGDNREGMVGFAELLLSHGYMVLLPDSRAHGVNGGAFPTYGISEANDVRRWYDWMENRDSPACVYGFGEVDGSGHRSPVGEDHDVLRRIAESPFASFRLALLFTGHSSSACLELWIVLAPERVCR